MRMMDSMLIAFPCSKYKRLQHLVRRTLVRISSDDRRVPIRDIIVFQLELLEVDMLQLRFDALRLAQISYCVDLLRL